MMELHEEVIYPTIEDEISAKKRIFIDDLSKTGGINKSCRRTGLLKEDIVRWRKEDVKFNNEILDTIEIRTENLESALYNQAINGNALANIFLLKSKRPEIYREKPYESVSKVNVGVIMIPKTSSNSEEWELKAKKFLDINTVMSTNLEIENKNEY